MSTAKTVLLIGGVDAHLERFAALGAKVILIQHPDKVTDFQTRTADVLVVVDYTEWDTVRPFAEAARAVYGVDAVVSLTEPGLNPAARLSDLFGLSDGHRYEVSRRMRDKWLMRRHLAEAGLPVPHAGLVSDRACLDAFGERAGYPFILKPVSTTAGFGLIRAEGPADLDRVWARVQELNGGRTDRGSTMFTVDGFLMESYIDGPEFSVEALSFAGRHVVVAVTEKLVDEAHFAELGHAVPARLADADRERLTGAVEAFLTAMGVTDGPSHTEIRLSGRGPVVIESHNRLGGDHIVELVEAAYGIDMIAYGAAWPLGLVEPLAGAPAARAGAAMRAVLRGPGTVTAVSGVEDVAARPDVLAAQVSVKPGDTVRPLRDNWDRLGSVVVRAADTDSAVELCEHLTRSGIRIDVEPVPQPAAQAAAEPVAA
ncbi:ATP-grasp domain-containing protein [Streptomyces antarcticus]|uniref:ATP-grasp domain-containing protein n=1 Tax=Streptomyces antarcticus TaxID=2996458 RepID=UPI00226E69CA|nr:MULTISPECIES: ATP-grasp domain-containing protein [unclassified Streptomyces]MCY0942947.1 ATP-grasp domain-containing protein [Streptomyces sp. H34-AA3]MCZ4083093.1 ATP-grasp domain-containing protein [Streptomyces sp. H34-S5]